MLSNGLGTGCSLKRSLGLMLARIAPFPFLLFLCQKELKSGKVASLFVAWSELWVSFLVRLVGFYPARLVGICPGYGTSSVPMV